MSRTNRNDEADSTTLRRKPRVARTSSAGVAKSPPRNDTMTCSSSANCVLTAREIVDTFVRVTGRRAHYTSAYAREDLLRNFPAFGADEWLVRELVGMVTYAVEYGYYAPDRDLAWSRRIDPGALTWEGFLRRSGWRGEPTSYGVATGS
jgi:hypothetical protein